MSELNKTITELPSILGTMPHEKAEEIMDKVLEVGFQAQGLGYEDATFPLEYSLEEICIASRLVKEHKGHPNPDGTRTMKMHMADRGIAAHYALAHYGDDPRSLLKAVGFCFTDEEDE